MQYPTHSYRNIGSGTSQRMACNRVLRGPGFRGNGIQSQGIRQVQAGVKIFFQDGELLIRGKRLFHPHMQSAKIHRIERMYGLFQRMFRIPAPIDAQTITASYDRGVLSIHLPKLKYTDVEQVKIPITFQ